MDYLLKGLLSVLLRDGGFSYHKMEWCLHLSVFDLSNDLVPQLRHDELKLFLMLETAPFCHVLCLAINSNVMLCSVAIHCRIHRKEATSYPFQLFLQSTEKTLIIGGDQTTIQPFPDDESMI
jgi:hypothetical protein